MKKNLILIAALSGLALAGCASKGSKTAGDPPVAVGSDSGISTAGTGGSGFDNGSAIGSGAATAAYSLATKTVYFAYDGTDIDAAGQTVVDNFGKYLTATPSAKLRLEGHADERGSAEYNIALGERRASAVARALKAAGASDAQLSVISYGEERPATEGHDEAAYAKNRRVELAQ